MPASTARFDENELATEKIHRRLMFDRIELNEGMLVKNVVAQMLTASGRTLHFYSENDPCKAEDHMEIDFLIANTKIRRTPTGEADRELLNVT